MLDIDGEVVVEDYPTGGAQIRISYDLLISEQTKRLILVDPRQ